MLNPKLVTASSSPTAHPTALIRPAVASTPPKPIHPEVGITTSHGTW